MSYPNVIEQHNKDIEYIKSTYLPLTGGIMTGNISGKGGYLILDNSMETGLHTTTDDETFIAIRNNTHTTLPSLITIQSHYETTKTSLEINGKENRIYAWSPIDVGENFLYFGHNGFSIRGWECPELENGCCHWEFRADDNIERFGGIYIANEEVPAGVFSKVRTEHNSFCVVEKWKNGTNWWRRWDDGWIEQGGIWNTSNTTLTFNRGFSDTNYIIVGSENQGDDNARAIKFNRNNATTTSIRMVGSANPIGVCWYACGY